MTSFGSSGVGTPTQQDQEAATDLGVVSLFAGVGGIDEAARRAGMRTLLACEIDKPCRAVLAEHFPEAVIHDDVRTLTADDIRAAGAVPRRTVLTAGWPCQGNSSAGRRAGMDDPRSGLWAEVARILAEFRPAWFVGENVPGLLSVNGGWDFATVLGNLAELGYEFAWRVLDAQHFGVPQRRKRVVLVGHLGDRAAPVEILFEPESSGRDHPPLREARETLAGTLGGGSGSRGWAPDTDRMTFVPTTAATLTAGISSPGVSAPGRRKEDDVNLVVTPLLEVGARTGVSTDDPRAGAGIGEPGDPMFTLQASKQHGVGVVGPLQTGYTPNGHGMAGVNQQHANSGHLIAFAWQAGGNNSASGAFNDDGTTPTLPRSQTLAVALRGRDGGATAELGDDVANTLRASQGGGDKAHALTDDAVRRLTPLECERLQGFPDNWTAGQSDAQRYKQMGNSVAVPVFEWVLRRLAAVDAQTLLLGLVPQ